MKIDRSIRPVGTTLLLALALIGCDPSEPLDPAADASRIQAPDGADDIRLARVAAADSNQVVDAQVEYLTTKSMQDVTDFDRDPTVRISGFSHAFSHKSQIQVGVFNLPADVAAPAALGEYRKSTGEFLREMIRSTTAALQDESDEAQRRSYAETIEAFKLRLSAFQRGKPGIYSIRVRARAGFLAELRSKDKTVRTVSLTDAQQGKFRNPQLPAEPELYEPICPLSIGVVPSTPVTSEVSISSMTLFDPCEPTDPGTPTAPPPIYSGPPSAETGISPQLALYVADPLGDPYNDDSYNDNNFAEQVFWAPTEGKSYLGRDAYSKYTVQHWLWKIPHLALYTFGNTRFSFEAEVHQDGRNGQPIYGNHLFFPANYVDRGQVWESNFPSAYLDTRIGDRPDIPNHTIGTTQPERLQYDKFYYTWIRFSQYYSGSSTAKIQIAVQLGDKSGFCATPNAWCTLNSLHTMRVLPWICGYRAPNATTMNNRWKRWYWDSFGYKNEHCRDYL